MKSMIKARSKKILSALLAMYMSASMISTSLENVPMYSSADNLLTADAGGGDVKQPPVKPNIWSANAKNFTINKIYTNGLLACGMALTSIANSTECEEFQAVVSFLNKWVFGASQGQTMGEIKAMCQQILKELDIIDTKLTSYSSEMLKTLGQMQYETAKKDIDEKWASDVSGAEDLYDISLAVDKYKKYMKASQDYLGENNNGTTISPDEFTSAQNDLFEGFCGIYSAREHGFSMNDTYEKKRELIFNSTTIRDAFESAIEKMSSNLNPTSGNTNFADTVAHYAFIAFPFASDQYEYIKTQIDKQFTEILIVEMAYQEYLSQQGAYFEEFYPDDEVKWNNYQQAVDKLASLNKLTGEAMENMLDRDLQVSSVNGIYMKLEEFPKPEDAQNIVAQNSKYKNADTAFWYPTTFITKNMKFNRVFTLTNNGINSFLILDAHQFKEDSSDGIPKYMHMTNLIYKKSKALKGDYHVVNMDFADLATDEFAKYGDGTNNNYKIISTPSDFKELFNTPAFSLCDSIPTNYLSDYISYAHGNPIYFLTSEYISPTRISQYQTVYDRFVVIDANQQEPSANFTTCEVSSEDVQADRDQYETAYAVVLTNNEKSGKSEVFNQNTRVEVTGNGSAEIYIDKGNGYETNTTQPAGSEITLLFKPSAENTVLKSLVIKRRNDASNKNNITGETPLLKRSDIEKLETDENGYYIYRYNVPYSDITVSLNAETGYKVYVQNETDSEDLITLDTYVNLFAEGETVSFIADKSVRNVELINGDSISEIPLREDLKGNFTGSFTMPANDVTLRYHASCENHNFSENGFCVNCGFYQPAVTDNLSKTYQISNAGMLYWFASLVNDDKSYAEFETKNGEARAVLVKDIIVNTDIQSANIRSWKPIGTEENSYSGQFDGQHHTVSGLYFNDSNADNVGLFGYTRGGADIKNVGIINSSFTGNNSVGGILGHNNNSGVSVQCCFSEADITGNECVAGISGSTYGGKIYDCYNAGSVKGFKYVASIRGKNTNSSETTGEIKNCFNVGSVSGDADSNIGGIRGDGNGSIKNCYCISSQLTDTSAETKSPEQFESGEVAYLLNSRLTNGRQIWYQNIDNGETPDNYPKFSGGTVYSTNTCSKKQGYSNYNSGLIHDFDDNGFCRNCGAYQPAVRNGYYYDISNAGMLYWFASFVNGDRTYAEFNKPDTSAYGRLVKDIVVNDVDISSLDSSGLSNLRKWIPIGKDTDYTGTFEGNFHTISGLYFNDSDADNIGLFGYLNKKALICDLGIVNSSFTGHDNVGGIVGKNMGEGVIISCCYNEATVSGNNNVSGIAGFFRGGMIVDCYNAGSVKGNEYVASIRGFNNMQAGDILNCFNVGSISGNSNVSGIIGNTNGKINNCYCISNQVTDSSATVKTPEEFASGEITYLLNKGVTNGSQIWYQNIDNGLTPDDYPKFTGGTVYKIRDNKYSNDDFIPAFDDDEDGNFIIKTYDDLEKLSNLVRSDYDKYGSANYILSNNIKAPENSVWTQGIGSVSDNKPFNGTFNGGGYCIIGLNVKSSEYGGLFEALGTQGTVKDLFVFDCDFESDSKTAGGIAALNEGKIDHCISGVNLTSGTIHLQGKDIEAASLNSKIKGDISGGIAGKNSGIINGCRNAAVISGSQCGGIAGENTGNISCCANNAITGDKNSSVSGGLAGKNNGNINGSYNSGIVNASSDNKKGSVAGVNGYDGKEPDIKNVFYSTANGLNAVGTDSEKTPDNTNIGTSNLSDYKTSEFVEKLNDVSNDSVTWIQNLHINKGNPTIEGIFMKIIVKSAGNDISVKGFMHNALNIEYQEDNKNTLFTSSVSKNRIVKSYSLNMTDKDGNYIPEELWCREGFEISVPVDNENVQLAAIDNDGNINYYNPDSFKDGKAVFTIPQLTSFAVTDTTPDNNDKPVNNNVKDSPLTGVKQEILPLILMTVALIYIVYFIRRRKKIGKQK